ncbi:MAG TPA: beta-propeller fold lactonase family protein, partial [Kofleriaceae bacterium]
MAQAGPRGAVYTSTNAADHNDLVVFARGADGRLGDATSVATGGTGTGVGLGSQGAIARSGRFLFVVNARSNDISTFELGSGAPRLVARTPSGGTMPISVTATDRLAYVLNAGGSGNIAGFWIDDDGALHRLAGATQPLSSAAANPAEIAFSPDGDTLIVSEQDTNVLDASSLDFFGRARGLVVHRSNGPVPFGFDFTPDGALIVS